MGADADVDGDGLETPAGADGCHGDEDDFENGAVVTYGGGRRLFVSSWTDHTRPENVASGRLVSLVGAGAAAVDVGVEGRERTKRQWATTRPGGAWS
jgi:hypothetical protein